MPGSGTMTGTGTTTTPVVAASATTPCSGRYAQPWEYAIFWCVNAVITGYHDGPGTAVLRDDDADFESWGIVAGMVAQNVTQGTYGVITAQTATSLTVAGVTWTLSDRWRVVPITPGEWDTIEHYLDIVANDIHAALAAVGACDCTLAAWGIEYLKKINIIEAGAFHKCSCGKPSMSDEERRLMLEWADRQLDLIRTGKTELCSGETGSEYPAVGWANLALTERGAAEIIANAVEAENA